MEHADFRKLAVIDFEGKLVQLELQLCTPQKCWLSEWLISSPARSHCDVRRASWEGHTQCRSRCHSGRWLCPPGLCAAGWLELCSRLPWHNPQTAWGYKSKGLVKKGHGLWERESLSKEKSPCLLWQACYSGKIDCGSVTTRQADLSSLSLRFSFVKLKCFLFLPRLLWTLNATMDVRKSKAEPEIH